MKVEAGIVALPASCAAPARVSRPRAVGVITALTD